MPAPEIASLLGLTPFVHAQYFHYGLNQLKSNGHGQEVIQTLERLAQVLVEMPPPLDYAQRRRQLSMLTDIDDDDWFDLWAAKRELLPVGPPISRHLIASAAWAELTGGDHRVAPAFTSSTQAVASVARRDQYRRFNRIPDVGALVHETSQRILTRSGLSGPVTWQPSLS
jgi:hypothetical protein